MKREDTATYKFVLDEKELFEDVQKANSKYSKGSDYEYSMLNYKKIIDDMCEYLEGYLEYDKGDDKKYSSKVLATTAKFYDAIFDSKKYRQTITFSDMTNITHDYLEATKKLQDIMVQVDDDDKTELHAMMIMTNNQYNKIARVFKDDMMIYLWLAIGYNISSDLRQKYLNKDTPVMHRK